MEFSPRAAELTTLLESRISNFYTNFQVDEIGRVVSVGDGIARVYGLNEIQAGEMWTYEQLADEIIGKSVDLVHLLDILKDLSTFGFASQPFHQLLDFLHTVAQLSPRQ